MSPRYSFAPSPLPLKAPDARANFVDALDFIAFTTDVIVSGEEANKFPEKEPNL